MALTALRMREDLEGLCKDIVLDIGIIVEDKTAYLRDDDLLAVARKLARIRNALLITVDIHRGEINS